jgi:hypothetical protein
MRSSHVVLDQVEAVFDDEQAVAGAGLLLPATLAERLGIKQATDQLVGLADRLVRPGSDASCSPWSPPWSRVPTASMTSRATVALSDQPIRLPSLCPSNTADDVLDRVFRAVLAGLYRRSLHFRRGSPTPFSSMQQCPLQRTVDDLDARARRLVRALELNAALDEDRGGGVALAEVHGRLAELQRQREATARDLATLDNQQQPADSGAVELLDALPVGTIALQGVPEPTLRRLFVAFQLRVRYDKHANWATLRVTLQEDRLDELLAVAGAITDPQQPLAHGDGIDDSPPFAHASPVPGATQSGKTTTLNCLAAAIPPRERVITCEEVFELQVGLPDTVAMQTRQPNLEGEGEIRQRRLIKEALRMRPDRLLVGEVRQEECLDLLIAFNSGIPGMTSVHANSAREALVKLTMLPLLAGENVSHRFILPTVASTIDLIVFLRADGWGRRRVEEVLAVSGRVEEDQVEAGLVFRRAGDRLLWTGEFPPHGERFRNHGFELVEVLAT